MKSFNVRDVYFGMVQERGIEGEKRERVHSDSNATIAHTSSIALERDIELET